MACRLTGAKPLHEPMMPQSMTALGYNEWKVFIMFPNITSHAKARVPWKYVMVWYTFFHHTETPYALKQKVYFFMKFSPLAALDVRRSQWWNFVNITFLSQCCEESHFFHRSLYYCFVFRWFYRLKQWSAKFRYNLAIKPLCDKSDWQVIPLTENQ